MHPKKKSHKIFRLWQLLLMASIALVLASSLAKKIKAKFEPVKTVANIQIGDKNFGVFSDTASLELSIANGLSKDEDNTTPTRISLKREFVTDPSLYHWARQSAKDPRSIKNIKITVQTLDGQPISTYTLLKSKPLLWTVEAADPAIGGFKERVDVAVQKISIH